MIIDLHQKNLVSYCKVLIQASAKLSSHLAIDYFSTAQTSFFGPRGFGEKSMIRRLFAASACLVLLHTPTFAASQFIGKVTMYLCDGGEDLCGNT
jgi:hypothetical protein